MKKVKYVFLLLIIVSFCLFLSSCLQPKYYTDIIGFRLPLNGIVVNTEATIFLSITEYRPIELKRYFIWEIDDSPDTITTETESLTYTFTTPGLHNIHATVEYEDNKGVGDFLKFDIDVRPAP